MGVYADIEGVIFLHETEDDIKVLVDEIGEVWIPKSQLDDFEADTYQPNQLIDIRVAEWVALKRGLI